MDNSYSGRIARMMAYTPQTIETLTDLRDEHPKVFHLLEEECMLIRSWLSNAGSR